MPRSSRSATAWSPCGGLARKACRSASCGPTRPGFISKRFPLPRLPLPRYGGACPLWAVYRAFQTPETYVPQHVAFPGGGPLPVRRPRRRQGGGQFRTARAGLLSVMLACDAVYADRIVYARGIDLGPRAAAQPVGTSCRICSRADCATRQEDPIVNP